MPDGIFDRSKSIVGTDVVITYNTTASRYELDDPTGTGTAKIAIGDGRVGAFESAAAACQTLAGTVGVGGFAVTVIDGAGAGFLTIEWQPASSRFKVSTSGSEFAHVPSGYLGAVSTAIGQIEADRVAEGV